MVVVASFILSEGILAAFVLGFATALDTPPDDDDDDDDDDEDDDDNEDDDNEDDEDDDYDEGCDADADGDIDGNDVEEGNEDADGKKYGKKTAALDDDARRKHEPTLSNTNNIVHGTAGKRKDIEEITALTFHHDNGGTAGKKTKSA